MRLLSLELEKYGPFTGKTIEFRLGARLHLVEPLGFSMEDRLLRRAGLDYHELTTVKVHRDWAACREARSAIGPIAGIDMSGVRFTNGAQASQFDAKRHFDDKQIVPLDRFAQLAIVAAREALANSVRLDCKPPKMHVWRQQRHGHVAWPATPAASSTRTGKRRR